MRIDIKWVGLPELQQRLRQAGRRAPELAGRALFEGGHAIMARSQEIVPFELGTLSSSGQVEPPAVDRNGASVTLGYGGAAKAYAVVQHERLDYRHAAGRQAKYLSEPAEQYADDMERDLARRLARLFDEGVI